eukprot:gene18371-biopygen12955
MGLALRNHGIGGVSLFLLMGHFSQDQVPTTFCSRARARRQRCRRRAGPQQQIGIHRGVLNTTPGRVISPGVISPLLSVISGGTGQWRGRGAGMARAWRGRGAGYRQFLAWGGAGVARAWRGRGAG